MHGGGLERFRKSQSPEKFSITPIVSPRNVVSQSVSPVHLQASQHQTQFKKRYDVPQTPKESTVAALLTEVGGGQSIWQPPDWAVEPQMGAYYLEVVKESEVIGQINLDKKRHIFGKLFPMCDFVLHHESISRQHAALVTHKNGSIHVIDLGSANGTFVSNERITKHNPVELKVGQSLRFGASTRTYILREKAKASDGEAANTKSRTRHNLKTAKRMRKARVSFRDQSGEELWEVIGTSDGADVETEISPGGVLSLLGEYESLVETTLFPKGKEHISLNKVKSAPKSGRELYGESFSGEIGSSWAYASISRGDKQESHGKPGIGDGDGNGNGDHHDDIFGD